MIRPVKDLQHESEQLMWELEIKLAMVEALRRRLIEFQNQLQQALQNQARLLD